MSKKAIFHGSITALVTPFANGEVDFEALRHLIDWQIENGTHGLVPVGTTGESPTLGDDHIRIVEITVQEAKKRAPVLAGAGGYNTHEVIELGNACKKAGADGILTYFAPRVAALLSKAK